MMKKTVRVLVSAAILLPLYANAQVFDDAYMAETATDNKAVVAKTENKDVADGQVAVEEQPFMPKAVEAPAVQQAQPKPATKVAKGDFSIRRIRREDEEDSEEEELAILLYFDNFSMGANLGGQVTCDVRFLMTHNFNVKLSSLGVKLVWPNLTTSLAFTNANPGDLRSWEYTLSGPGCYEMDKIPNIVVNRCRAKGMSQEECADKIKWLSAN